MINLQELSPEYQKLIKSIYLLGWSDGEVGLKPYNNLVTNEEEIEYIETVLLSEGELKTIKQT